MKRKGCDPAWRRGPHATSARTGFRGEELPPSGEEESLVEGEEERGDKAEAQAQGEAEAEAEAARSDAVRRNSGVKKIRLGSACGPEKPLDICRGRQTWRPGMERGRCCREDPLVSTGGSATVGSTVKTVKISAI